MKRSILVVFAMLASSVCYAVTLIVDNPSPKINGVEICKDRALSKLVGFDVNATADIASFRLVELDARVLNPSHYAWYEIEISSNGAKKTVRTLVQLNRITGSCI